MEYRRVLCLQLVQLWLSAWGQVGHLASVLGEFRIASGLCELSYASTQTNLILLESHYGVTMAVPKEGAYCQGQLGTMGV